MASQKTSDILLSRLAESLDSTANLTQVLLADLKESEADFASIKNELTFLKENVKGLSVLIKDGEGTSSILARVNIIEQAVESIKKWVDSHVDVHQNVKSDIKDIRIQLSEIEKKFETVSTNLQELKDSVKVNSNTGKRNVLYLAGVTILLLGLISGYIANACTAQGDTGASVKTSSQISQKRTYE